MRPDARLAPCSARSPVLRAFTQLLEFPNTRVDTGVEYAYRILNLPEEEGLFAIVARLGTIALAAFQSRLPFSIFRSTLERLVERDKRPTSEVSSIDD